MSKRAIFFDRDGTLIEHYDYLTEPSQVELLPKVAQALKYLKARGFALVVVTNQSAVAQGKLTEKKLNEIHDRLKLLLGQQGAYLDKIYYCPYHPEGELEEYRVASEMRKPGSGMLKQAAGELDVDLSQSWMVGDDDRDIEAGKAAGCRTIMLEKRGSALVQRGKSEADYQAVNLQEAANIVGHYCDVPAPVKQPATENAIAENYDVVEEETGDKVEKYLSENEPKKTEETISTSTEDSMDSETDYQTEVVEEATEVAGDADNKRLLSLILRELKNMNRDHSMGSEFSIFKLLAGVVQMVVIFCLVVAFWFASGTEFQGEQVIATLLAGLVFQTMVVAFLMIARS